MDTHMTAEPSVEEKLAIVRTLWNANIQEIRLGLYQCYFNYYQAEIELLTRAVHKSPAPICNLPVTTHKGLCKAVSIIHKNGGQTRDELRESFRCDPDLESRNSSGVQHLIDLALRISLMINIRESECTYQTRSNALQWHDKSTLVEFVAEQFPKVDRNFMADKRLPPNFNVPFMVKACGLTVEWTVSLVDHLRFDQTRKSVKIFHLKQCLIDVLEGQRLVNHTDLLPRQMVQQTIWTLNLLFPENSLTDEFLLRKKDDVINLFAQGNTKQRERPRNLEEYDYWYRRLQDLLELYDSGPNTLSQYLAWAASYEKLNWLVALVFGFFLALVFGVIASATAILSYKKTVEAFELAKMAYDLQQKDWDRQQLSPICPCS